ncbi:MAG: hypothetical protein ACTTJ4_00775 [Treponema sp.]|uniref:hypothetical protein n=1 Tax=Treponema sp. TaxID=166 RepID=UPI003FA2E804
MKVLLDTNILVDFLAKRPVFFNSVECIITRNKKDFFGSKIPVYTPDEFLA